MISSIYVCLYTLHSDAVEFELEFDADIVFLLLKSMF